MDSNVSAKHTHVAKLFSSENKKPIKEEIKNTHEKHNAKNSQLQKRIYLNLVDSERKSKYSLSSIRVNTRENSSTSSSSDVQLNLASTLLAKNKLNEVNTSMKTNTEKQYASGKTSGRDDSNDHPSSKSSFNQFQMYKNTFPQRNKYLENRKESTDQETDWGIKNSDSLYR